MVGAHSGPPTLTNEPPQVNGKKLLPNSGVIIRFMAPLLLWAAAVVIVFGVSFTQLANLQGPLSSLNAAAHVNYRVSRVRLMGNMLAYSESDADNDLYRGNLLQEIATLRSEVSRWWPRRPPWLTAPLAAQGWKACTAKSHTVPTEAGVKPKPPLPRLQYSALLYGGRIPPVNPSVTFDAVAPPSTFASAAFADLFFKTTE